MFRPTSLNMGMPDPYSDYIGLSFMFCSCVYGGPRLWTETQALFGPQMTDVWSGGVACT